MGRGGPIPFGYPSGGVNLSDELSPRFGGYPGGGRRCPAIIAPPAIPPAAAPRAVPGGNPPLPLPPYPPLISVENPPRPG